MGDCTLGTDEYFDPSTSLNAYYHLYGPDYFFQNVRPILEKDDLSIVNMEGTLTDSSERQEKTYAFKAPAEYAAILSDSSVEAANLANNHSADYGSQSQTDTINALEEKGVATFGFDRVKILDIKGIKVGITGIYELAEHMGKSDQVIENISALKEDGAQLIIVNFHWGIEKEYTPNDTQIQLAHLAINNGADLVIGHHPHVLQGIEQYKGKYIAYSLGNFCFGGNSNPSDKDTLIVQQTFTFQSGELEKSSDLNLIPCSISSSKDYNDYCPTPLEGDDKQRVLDNVKQYSNNL
ncbi:MAG: CapA family protein [Dorea sp.]